jgi:chorismate dehydratase
LPKIINLNKYRIGLVNYTNTIPYLWCFTRQNKFSNPLVFGNNQIELVQNYPSALAKMMEENQLDAAILPVATLLNIKGIVPITNYGIACKGNVDSVCLFSNNPITDINTVLLDPQSRTSNLLTQILFKNYWKQQVNFESAFEGYQNAIGNNTAAVVIGDRAFAQAPKNSFKYDLGQAWEEYTGLPFLFARWVATTQKANEIELVLNQLFETHFNINNSLELINHQNFDAQKYITQTIKYHITPQMEEAMQLFFEKVKAL